MNRYKEKSKGVSLKDDLTIDADEFEYDLKLNYISASNKVHLKDNNRNYYGCEIEKKYLNKALIK